MSIYEPIQNVYGNVELLFSINTHYIFLKYSRETKRTIWKQEPGGTIKSFFFFLGNQRSLKRRWSVQSDSSTATTRFWSCFIPLNVWYVKEKQYLTLFFFFLNSAPNIKKKYIKHVQHIVYAEHLTSSGPKKNVFALPDLMNAFVHAFMLSTGGA